MKLHITYLKQALEQAKKDRALVQKAQDYFIHIDISNKVQVQFFLDTQEKNPDYLSQKINEAVDLDFAIRDLSNIIWREEQYNLR